VYQGAGYSAALVSTATANAAAGSFQDISRGQGTAILTNTDDAFTQVPLGFSFTFFGVQYNSIWVTSNGLLSFSALPTDTGYTNYVGTDLTTNTGPNRPLIAPLWDDWVVTSPGNVYYATLGNPGNREFIAQWNQVVAYPTSASTVTFEVALFESNDHIEFRYQNVIAGNGTQANVHDNGMNATIGIRSGFPGVNANNLEANGGGPVPSGVGGIQIATDGGPSHLPVIQNGTTITFTPNVPPTGLALSSSSLIANRPINTVIGTFSTTDADIPNDSFTYSLVNGTTPNDNALFTIVADQLETNTVLANGPRSQYTVLVQTQNLAGESYLQQLTINVIHVNQPPVVAAGQVFSVTQGTPAGAVIGTVAASDPNVGQQPPTALTFATTSTVFAVNPTTGQIAVADPTAIDSGRTAVFTVPITVNDNGNPPLSTSAAVTVNVISVPLTASIVGAPASSPEGTPISLQSVVTDANGQSFSHQWSVTHNGLPVTTGLDTLPNGPSFSFTPAATGNYIVTLTVTDQRGQTVSPTAAIAVTDVPPVVNVGSGNSISSTARTFTRTIGFSSLGTNWSVAVDYGDGTTESFNLTPGNHNFDPAAKTFTIQHNYTTVSTFTVAVTVTDGTGGSGTATFPVTVFDPEEFARLIAFAIGIADATGTAQVDLGTADPNVLLDATMTDALPGNTVALSVFNGDPEPDSRAGQPSAGNLIPIGTGGLSAPTATPLAFVDTRAVAPSSAIVNEAYELVVPSSMVNGPVQLFWFNKALGIWEAATGQGAGDGVVTITPILDGAGHATGKSLLRFTETFGSSSSPNIGHLTGTVFSIAVPVGNGGSSTTTVVLASLLANTGPAIGTSVQTTGFGSGSNLTLSLQESQLNLVLTGLAGARIPTDAPGEVDNGVAAGDSSDDQLLNWLINGELWRERRRPRAGADQQPPPTPNDQQPPPPGPQQPGAIPHELAGGFIPRPPRPRRRRFEVALLGEELA